MDIDNLLNLPILPVGQCPINNIVKKSIKRVFLGGIIYIRLVSNLKVSGVNAVSDKIELSRRLKRKLRK